MPTETILHVTAHYEPHPRSPFIVVYTFECNHCDYFVTMVHYPVQKLDENLFDFIQNHLHGKVLADFVLARIKVARKWRPVEEVLK